MCGFVHVSMVAEMVPPAPLLFRPCRITLDPQAYRPSRTYQKKNQLALLRRRRVLYFRAGDWMPGAVLITCGWAQVCSVTRVGRMVDGLSDWLDFSRKAQAAYLPRPRSMRARSCRSPTSLTLISVA